MKRILAVFFVLGIVVFNSCKKDQLLNPEVNNKINGADSKILCTGCGGGWDLNGVENFDGAKGNHSSKVDSILNLRTPSMPR